MAAGDGGGGLQRSYFDVLGICCASEIPMIENILKPLDGVKEITVIVATKTVIVVHDNLLISQAQIVKALNQARLEANVRAYGEHRNHRKKWPTPVAAAAGLLLMLSLLKYVNPLFRWLAVAAVAVGVWPIAVKSFAAVRGLRIDINILALIAVIGTMVMKDYLEAATIVFLFNIAEWLESRAGHKANDVMSSLLSMAPQKAVLADTGEVIAADEVKLGALLAVKAGEVIPIDGVVVEGKCEVDEKTLTGESFPVAKQENSTVWAGTINLNGYITVKTTALAGDCVVAKMAKLVEEAQNNKSKTQRFIDKCAKYYTPTVLVISTCIAVIPAALRLPNRNRWFQLALVVLVSACPCALILSTPVATFCALTKAATSGLLIKGGDYLETLAKIKIMAFDKTGTITRGEFMVTKFQALHQDSISLNLLLYWVSSIESKSSHPMAAALIDHGRSLSIDPKPENVDDFQNFPGEGVHGKIDGNDIYIGNRKIATRANCTTVSDIEDDAKDGRTVGYIFCGAIPAGIFHLSDSCRTGAKEAMEELQSLGIKTAMLTGDSSASALQAQKELGKALEIVHAELLPEDKTRLVNDFKKDGPTAMIGDGLNDAPALATADIGISMGISGSALAIETGDVILMSNDIRKVPKAIRLARRARMKVIQNVVLSITPRIAILGLAFAGHPLVWAAVLGDVATCVLVILNSMLLLRGTNEQGGKAAKFSAAHHSKKHGCCHDHSHFDQHDNHVVNHGCTDGVNHSSKHHVSGDGLSRKKTQEGCRSRNCASKCHSGTTNSSSCKKSRAEDSTSKQDDSASSGKLHECGSHIHNNQSPQHDRHSHSSCADRHNTDGCCSQKNTQESCMAQKCASICQSKTPISSSCEKTKCTNSTSKLDESAGSVELHKSGCCTHNSQLAEDDHLIQFPEYNASNSQTSSPSHHIGTDCCSQGNSQKVSFSPPKFCSKTCNSSSCGKIKCADSTVRRDGSAGNLELQDQKPSSLVSLCTEDECSYRVADIVECANSDGVKEVKLHSCNATCHKKSGRSNGDDNENHSNLQEEGVHADIKAGHRDLSGALLGPHHLNLEPKNACKAMKKRETSESCNSCKKECAGLKIGQSCASLEKREMGGCCKSYMKECCRKHGDIGTTVRGGLNEIIIE